MMKNKSVFLKRKLWIPSILIIAVVVLALILPWPTNIDVTMPGKWVPTENQEGKPVTFRLEGKLNRYLIRRSQWKGLIQISGYSPFDTGKNIEIKLDRNAADDVLYGPVFLYDQKENRFVAYGTLYFQQKLDYIYLQVPETFGGGIIVAPEEMLGSLMN